MTTTNQFYNKIHKFILTNEDQNDDLSTNEADAILHYIITLSEVVRSTYHKPIKYEKKALILIDRYHASISSEYGFSQNCRVYSKQYVGYDEIVYDVKIDPGIVVQKMEKYHMIKDGTMRPPYQYIPDLILTHSLNHDPRVKTNQECLDKILKLNMVANNNRYKESIEKLTQDLLTQKDNVTDNKCGLDNLKRKNNCNDDQSDNPDESNKKTKDDK